MESANYDIRFLKGVGEKRARLFSRLGVFDIGTLLRLYPRAYEDWSKPFSIISAPLDEVSCIKAKLMSAPNENRIRKGMTLYKFEITDDTGIIRVTLFNNKYLAQKLHTDVEYLFYGKVTGKLFGKEMASPEIRPISMVQIRPIYPATEGLTSRIIENTVRAAIQLVTDEDTLPAEIRSKYRLCSLRFALENIHFPRNKEALDEARNRLIFEELFVLQLGMLLLKKRNRNLTGIKLYKDYTSEFIKMLPFKLTGAQQRVINECIDDMTKNIPMNRLVQGDVGSGKTAVAAALMYSVINNGYQATMMAPTEILAEQHYRSISNLYKDSGIEICLLTGSVGKKDKDKIKEGLACGEIQLVIGTHALLEENVAFERLGLVITDEQHRFGVAQRGKLASKGDNPHLLVMSATPIPRTLALIIYGDLEVSIIDELPPGRQPINTYAVRSKLHTRIYRFIKKHLDEGRQAYIVCPLVEEGELDLISAEEYHKTLSEKEFKDYRLGLLHGKMRSAEKDSVMGQFANGEIQLLIATTVIEVGVDVPNAVIMAIENAERFGLSQLHQLRGRIGRGRYESFCILISDAVNKDTVRRLEIMCETSDGFRISDEDLKLRGPGDFFGKRQHGLPDLKIADMAENMDVLKIAGEAARIIISSDVDLSKPENAVLKLEVKKLFAQSGDFGFN